MTVFIWYVSILNSNDESIDVSKFSLSKSDATNTCLPHILVLLHYAHTCLRKLFELEISIMENFLIKIYTKTAVKKDAAL